MQTAFENWTTKKKKKPTAPQKDEVRKWACFTVDSNIPATLWGTLESLKIWVVGLLAFFSVPVL